MIATQDCPTRAAVTQVRFERIKGGELPSYDAQNTPENATLGRLTVLAWFMGADKASMLQAYVTSQRHRLILCRRLHECDCTYALDNTRLRCLGQSSLYCQVYQSAA